MFKRSESAMNAVMNVETDSGYLVIEDIETCAGKYRK